MSTAPVVKETTTQKVESFFSKFGDTLKTIFNVATNVAVEELPAVQPLLPPAIYSQVAAAVNLAAQQVAAADAKYAAIGSSAVPYGVKVAEAVAVGGEGVLALLAQNGLLLTGHLFDFFAAAGTIASSLNLVNITAPPAA